MDIIIQSPRIKLSRRIERVIYDKFERLEKASDRVIRCEVVLKKVKDSKNNGYLVEARLVVPGNDLYAKESGPKFEVAAEDACLDLERQLRKRKVKPASRRAGKVEIDWVDRD